MPVLQLPVFIPAIKAGMPKTRKTFAIFEPTTFPRAIPGASLRVALIATNNSGADVPNATTVNETIKAGILIFKLKFTAPRTSKSPATKRTISPNSA